MSSIVKLNQIDHEIEKAQTVGEHVNIDAKLAAIAKYAKRDGTDLAKQNEIAAYRLKNIRKAGGMLLDIPRSVAGRPQKNSSPKETNFDAMVREAGIARGTAYKWQALAKLPEAEFANLIQQNGRELTVTSTIASAQREISRKAVRSRLTDIGEREVKSASGTYDVLVIDPPWPMEKIERDERPNQVHLDYPTMSEEQLATINLPLAEDAHVWLWTTHKFLPMAFRLLDAWKLKYVCAFVWHKPGGFQPMGLPQFNCEFALYARHGAPVFVDTKTFNTCFQAPRGKHSEKPEEFYAMLRRVTAGRRLDMFNRRAIEGFDRWGNEVTDAA